MSTIMKIASRAPSSRHLLACTIRSLCATPTSTTTTTATPASATTAEAEGGEKAKQEGDKAKEEEEKAKQEKREDALRKETDRQEAKKEADSSKKEEEDKAKHEQEEAAQKREEEVEKREEKAQNREEEVEKREQEVQQKYGKAQKSEDEAEERQKKEEKAQIKREEEVQKREEEVQEKEENVQEREEEAEKREVAQEEVEKREEALRMDQETPSAPLGDAPPSPSAPLGDAPPSPPMSAGVGAIIATIIGAAALYWISPAKQKELRIKACVQLLKSAELPQDEASLTGKIEHHLDDIHGKLSLAYNLAFLEGPLGMGKTTAVKNFARKCRDAKQGVYMMSFKKVHPGDAQELFYKGKLVCSPFLFSIFVRSIFCVSCSIYSFLRSGAYGVLGRVRGSPCPSSEGHGQKGGADHR
jgi:hypothetical protein